MLRARPQTAESLQVGFGAVGFVLGKPIARILALQRKTEMVARHFRDNRGATDKQASGIAFDNRPMRHRQPLNRQTVNKGKRRSLRQRFKCAPHRQMGGIQDIQRIDFFRRGNTHAAADFRMRGQHFPEFFPLFFRKLFGIVHAFEVGFRQARQSLPGNFHRPCDHRPGKATAPGFINAGKHGLRRFVPKSAFKVQTVTRVICRWRVYF